MRLCTNCYHVTTGKPLYCNKCGCTYNLRLCRGQHANPRAAKICATCGSKELSIPQPKAPLLLRPFLLLAGIGPGILLLLLLVGYVGYYAYQLVTDPNGLLPLMGWGLLLCLLFALWMILPKFVRGLVKGLFGLVFRRKDSTNANHHGHH